jgi:O-antigen ligase
MLKLRTVAGIYALWLVAIEVIFYVTYGKSENVLQLVVVAGCLPAGLQLLLVGFNPYGLVSPAKFALLFLAVILLSYMGNTSDWLPFVFFFNTVFLFGIAIIVAACPNPRLLPMIAAAFSAVNGAFLVYINIAGEYIWGRLAAHDIEPNFWGVMGLASAATAFGFRNRVLGAAGFAIGLWTIYNASARGSLLGAVAGAGVIALLWATQLRGYRLIGSLAAAAAATMVFLAFSSLISDTVANFVTDVMKLDDPMRGTGAGFTGRSEIWASTIDLWTKSPLLGVGFRQHEHLLNNVSAHNAYLAMLADTGIFGLLLYLIMIGMALTTSRSIADPQALRVTLAVVIGYAVLGFFERRAINAGNPYGVLFMLCCFYPLVQHQLQRTRSRLERTAASLEQAARTRTAGFVGAVR